MSPDRMGWFDPFVAPTIYSPACRLRLFKTLFLSLHMPSPGVAIGGRRPFGFEGEFSILSPGGLSNRIGCRLGKR